MSSLNATFGTHGSLGVINPTDFPTPPELSQGLKWEHDGIVQLIPIDKYVADTVNDAVMTVIDKYHEEEIYNNLSNTGFDHSQEPAHVVYDEKTKTFVGKTGRTRARCFKKLNQPLYPVRIMKYIEGYDEDTSSFNEAIKGDISHKPSRSPKWTTIADTLLNLKIKNIPWYHGQTKNSNGEYDYEKDSLKYWFYKVAELNQRYDDGICTKIENRIIAGGTTAQDKVKLLTRKDIEEELIGNDLYNESDGFDVSLVCMDDAAANAPAKLRSILKFYSGGNPGRYILYTKRCRNAEEIRDLRVNYAKALRRAVVELAQFFLKDEVSDKRYDDIVNEKVETFFDNFELYSYNYMKEVEEDLVPIAI
tara:strand:+ start:600 stop:1688 length:1089 start_codon:yes stop_codon:yes gene_type:complete